MESQVRIENLDIVARGPDGKEFPIVQNVSLSVEHGEVLALIGESGSGKTTIALTLLGYTRPGCRISGGSVNVAGQRLTDMQEAELRALRGSQVAYVAQSAAAAFNPALTIMRQVIEPALIHGLMTRTEAIAKAKALFAKLALPDPEGVGDRFPHQVSGGQLQRLLAAMALITDPKLVIFDEPTTALDVTTQIEVLKAFKNVVREFGTTAVYVSHDLAVVAQIADRITVLRDGAVQETGSVETILRAPQHEYSQALVAAAAPRLEETSSPPPQQTPGEAHLLSLRKVMAGFGSVKDGIPAFPILEDIDLSIRKGQVLGVIGESGCGKSTLARVIAGLHPPAAGHVQLDGIPLPQKIAQRSKEQLRRIQIVFQSADTALNPAVPVSAAIGRPLTFFHGLRGKARRTEITRIFDLVKLPSSLIDRLPGELSGGQKQRVNLARALAARPDLILCDEVTSALDPVVAEAVLDLLIELRRELGVAYMFITHDLQTVKAIADDIVVLYRGRIVEHANRASQSSGPRHPYARLLMSSVPELREDWLEDVGSMFTQGPAAGKVRSDGGCIFFGRCGLAMPGICNASPPPVRTYEGRAIHCHRTIEELQSSASPAMPDVVPG